MGAVSFHNKKQVAEAIFIIVVLFVIPLTVVASRVIQDQRSRASEPQPTIQIGTFQPNESQYATSIETPHKNDELIIKFRPNVAITTQSGNALKEGEPYSVYSLEGLPQDIKESFNTQHVETLTKLFNIPVLEDKEVLTDQLFLQSTSAKRLNTLYKIKFPPTQDIAPIMKAICSSQQIEYCEPQYEPKPASAYILKLVIEKVVAKSYAAHPPIVAVVDQFGTNGERGHGDIVSDTVASAYPNVILLSVDVTNSSFADAIYSAVTRGANVINISLDYGNISGPQYNSYTDALQYANSHGVVVVSSAGNYQEDRAGSPSQLPGVIAVGALNGNSTEMAWYSNHGDRVEIFASDSFSNGNPGGGTSNASPKVAALASEILGINPNLSPEEVRSIIDGTAKDLGAPGKDTMFGFGAIDREAALGLASRSLSDKSAIPDMNLEQIDLSQSIHSKGMDWAQANKESIGIVSRIDLDEWGYPLYVTNQGIYYQGEKGEAVSVRAGTTSSSNPQGIKSTNQFGDRGVDTQAKYGGGSTRPEGYEDRGMTSTFDSNGNFLGYGGPQTVPQEQSDEQERSTSFVQNSAGGQNNGFDIQGISSVMRDAAAQTGSTVTAFVDSTISSTVNTISSFVSGVVDSFNSSNNDSGNSDSGSVDSGNSAPASNDPGSDATSNGSGGSVTGDSDY